MTSGRQRTRPVIVGGGNAGLVVAARLSELGCPALLIEKGDHLGGQLTWSSGQFSAAGTNRQRRHGIVDTAEQHYADVMAIGHNRNTAELVRLATSAAGEAVDWLDARGFPFADRCPAVVRSHEPYAQPRTYWGRTPGQGGLDLLHTIEPLIDRSIVEVRLGVPVVSLVTELRGSSTAVRGLVVGAPLRSGAGSSNETIATDEVVLATGGYAANRMLVAQLQPASAGALTGCLDHATGDGHRMLMDLGVPMTHSDTYVPTMGMIEDPAKPGYGLRLIDARVVVDAVARPPWEVWVNARGERFVDESTPHPSVRERALLDQPGLVMWSVFDQRILHQAPTPAVGPGWTAQRLQAAAGVEPWICRGEDLPALAQATGLPAATLARTVAEWNAGLGRPDPLGRRHRPLPISEPPFYAVRSAGGMLLSRGGPSVDATLRPVGPDGLPIEGCYAVGELLGMGQFSGDAFAGGMSVGPALSLGWWLAERIAASRRY